MKFFEFDLMTGSTGQIVMVEGKPFVIVSRLNAEPVTLSPMPYLVKLLGLKAELDAVMKVEKPMVRRYRP